MSGFVSSGFSVGGGNGYKGAFAMAIVGGTVSEIGGGKFANGAWGSAFQYMFNDLTLKQSMAKLWDRKGEIWSDVGEGFEGGLNGYREVRDNAPIYASWMLKGAMSATEMGLTVKIPSGIIEIYDFTSGMFFDTVPTSGFGWAGSFTKDGIDISAESLK